MKKFVSIMLSLLMIFSLLAFNVSAAKEENVARMWFCSEIHNKTNIGHIFLYFENLTDEPIMVGRYKVAPYDDVSVGCFGTEGPRGGGVYYNLEQDLTHYHSLKAVSTDLTEAELNKVTNKIKNYSHWDPILNCYYFAAMGWNAGAESSIPFLLFPTFARAFIQMRGGISNPFELFTQNDPVYRQNEL